MKLRKKEKTTNKKGATREYQKMSKIRWIHITSIMVVLVILAVTGWFIYFNIYQTIGKVQTLLTNETNPNFEPINFRLYNETTEAWDKKYKNPDIILNKNPFNAIVITTSTPNTTSTEEITSPPPETEERVGLSL